MKNIKEVKKDISKIENISFSELNTMKPIDIKRMYKKLDLLRIMEKYLETSPTSEFIDQELGRLEAIITAKSLEFQRVSEEREYEKLAKKEVSKLKKKHEDMYEIPKYRIQVKALRFLAA